MPGTITDVSNIHRIEHGQYSELAMDVAIAGPWGHYDLDLLLTGTPRETVALRLFGDGQRRQKTSIAASFGQFVEFEPGDPVQLRLEYYDIREQTMREVDRVDLTDDVAAALAPDDSGGGDEGLDALAEAVDQLRQRTNDLEARLEDLELRHDSTSK